MFKLPKGIMITDLCGIEEGYEERKRDSKSFFTVNVSAENIAKYFRYLCSEMGQPGFFVVELPATENEEKELRKDKTYPFHNHVYYLDNISVAKANKIFNKFERLLVHDGMVNFGYGTAEDEVFVGQYKIFQIHTVNPDKYIEAMKSLDIERKEHLKTVCDNFSQNSPGQRKALSEKPSVWDMLEELKEIGFYFAETREG